VDSSPPLPKAGDGRRVKGREPDDADESILRQLLEGIVADELGSRAASIETLQRTRARYIGSYDCDTVTVQLADGQDLSFFLKDFGFSQKTKDDPTRRRERELRVYRDLLAGAGLGTARYYGSLWNESQGRYWLLLELVDGVVVKDQNVEHGSMAAGWLGEMHGYFLRNPERLEGCDFLTRHDAEYFRSKAAQAVSDAEQIAPPSAARLARIAERYRPITKVMASQPLTLVHGAYIPWHIVLDTTRQPVRVCPIDWELAALGAPLYDLAFFIDGAEPEARDLICDAYLRAAEEQGVPAPDTREARYIVDCFRLHRIFDWLSRSVEKRFSEEKLATLGDQAERQIALL
jgi:aminoglycoside phosphotransferase (APT) family kinase protein